MLSYIRLYSLNARRPHSTNQKPNIHDEKAKKIQTNTHSARTKNEKKKRSETKNITCTEINQIDCKHMRIHIFLFHSPAIKHLCSRAPSVSLERSVVANGRTFVCVCNQNQPFFTLAFSSSSSSRQLIHLCAVSTFRTLCAQREAKAVSQPSTEWSQAQSVSGKSLRCSDCECSTFSVSALFSICQINRRIHNSVRKRATVAMSQGVKLVAKKNINRM